MSSKCPECGSDASTTIFRRHNFAFPLSPFEPTDTLTIRFPMAKCSACQCEYRNSETMEVVSKAIGEHLEQKFEAKEQVATEMKRYARQSWIMQGVIIGTLFAHSLNLFIAQRILFGSALMVTSLFMFLTITNVERIFKLAGRRKDKKDQPKVEINELMDQLVNQEVDDDDDE